MLGLLLIFELAQMLEREREEEARRIREEEAAERAAEEVVDSLLAKMILASIQAQTIFHVGILMHWRVL